MLTILIPTRNRWEFLGRLLRYHFRVGMPYPIRIGDSSDPDQRSEAERVLKDVSGRLNVEVRPYPGVSNLPANLDLLERVSTPYVISTADDDFLVVRGIRKAVEFLESHPDYSAAHGESFLFDVVGDRPHGNMIGVSRYPQHAFEQDTASGRLLQHLPFYSPTVHSVHRTENLRDSYRFVIGLGLDNNFGELMPSCIPSIRGKVRKLNTLYMVRQAHAGMTSRKTSPMVFDWITMPAWPNQWEKFSACMAAELARRDGIPMEAAIEIVRRAFWAYLARALEAKLPPVAGAGVPPSWPNVPWRRPSLSKIWDKARSFISGDPWGTSLKSLLCPSSPHHLDFMPIYQAVTSR